MGAARAPRTPEALQDMGAGDLVSQHASAHAGAAGKAARGEHAADPGADAEADPDGDEDEKRTDEAGGGIGATAREDADELDRLDPSARQAAHLAAPGGAADASMTVDAGGQVAVEAPLRGRSLEELLPLLVRRIAWGGDRHKGTVRLELGAGAYAGTTVIVHADGGRVRVEIGGHEGPEIERLRERLDARLRSHGLDVESVT